MNFKRFLLGLAAAATLGLGAISAQAAPICSGCNYVGPPATYLGAHDATTNDVSTFQHIFTGIISTGFSDFWVFDITPAAAASASANFTVLAQIAGFTGSLWTDAGSVCLGAPGTACAAVGVGVLIASDLNPNPQVFELFVANLAAGRYVLIADGTTNAQGNSAYTGQVSFVTTRVPEPATLALLAIGLIGVAGFTMRKGR